MIFSFAKYKTYLKRNVKAILPFAVTPESQERLNRGGLPSETLKSGSLDRGESKGGAEGAVLRVSAPWRIGQMCRFEFSPERPPRSWDRISNHN